ncbi:MAG TPA: heavy-metal-associated domain-containing protein [Nordella sp.]|nr:heavy-metal-associated domain-containing protein [Nordella sp.]
MYRFNVPDMTCGHCAGVVRRAVKLVDGQAEVTVDLGRKLVEIRSGATQQSLGEAIRKAGYDNSVLAG